jgi:hypothetical protein
MPANTKRVEVTRNHSKENRSLEHDRLSEKGWNKYKASTSSFLSDCQPQFVKTAKELSKPKNKQVLVYFVRFRSKVVPTCSFVKIGITNDNSLRFNFDSHKFDITTLAKIFRNTRKEALAIEKSILKQFKQHLRIPSIKLLSGGNSECFEDVSSIEQKIIAALNKIAGKSTAVIKVPEIGTTIPYQIHILMKMIDFKDALILNSDGKIIDYNKFELQRILGSFRGNLKSLGAKVPTKVDILQHFITRIKPLT